MSTDIKTIKFNETEDDNKYDFFPDEEIKDIKDDISEEDEKDDFMSDGGASIDTVKLLSKDALYLIMTKVFMNKDGKNIVNILEKINDNLEKLVAKK